jgi:predicted GIY-YIG superfamily endonuclease
MRTANLVYLLMLASFHAAMGLEHLLKAYRVRQAARRDLPCYSVLGDVLIRQIVERKPRDAPELSQIRGMTGERCQWYGEDILRMVRQAPFARAPLSSEASQPKVVMRHSGGGAKLTKPRPQRRGQSGPYAPAPLVASQRPARRVLEPATRPCGAGDDVYVLELASGRVYVGKSGNVGRRVGRHMSGGGAAFTKAFPPTGNRLPRLGNVSGAGDAAERDETLRYMFLRGIRNVRGWRYTCVEMSDEMFEDAERNIRELFDLCRRCGGGGHFMTACRFQFDRLGRRIPLRGGA